MAASVYRINSAVVATLVTYVRRNDRPASVEIRRLVDTVVVVGAVRRRRRRDEEEEPPRSSRSLLLPRDDADDDDGDGGARGASRTASAAPAASPVPKSAKTTLSHALVRSSLGRSAIGDD